MDLHLAEILRDDKQRRGGQARGNNLTAIHITSDDFAIDRRADDGVG
jgi:hypothetical protein